MNGNNKIISIIFAIVILVGGFFLFKFVILKDFTAQEDYVESGSSKNEKPALTLKSDKEAQADINQKQADDKGDKKEGNKKDEDKSDKKSEDNPSEDQLRKDAKDNALKTLEIKAKPKEEFKKKTTQSLFGEVATKEYVKSHQENNNKDDKTIKYKNVSLDISDKDLKKSNAKGTLKFDRLINPKSKKSDIKPSTEVDSKVSVKFKKVNNTFKVDSIQS